MLTHLRRLVLPAVCAGIGALACWLGTVEGYGFVRWAGVVVLVLSVLAGLWVLVEDRLPGARGAGVTAADLRPLAATRAELAARLGWEVRNSEPGLLEYARSGLLTDGAERRANHVLTGVRQGLRFAVFEYIRRRPGDDGPVGTTVWMVLLPEPVAAFDVWVGRQPAPPGLEDRLRESGLVHLQADGPTLITHRPGFASGGGAQTIVVRDVDSLLGIARALLG